MTYSNEEVTYSSVVGDFITLMQEAKDGLSEKDASDWAYCFVYNLETHDQAKDMAHYLDISSLEILHHQTLRAKLRKVISQRLLNAADDEINQDDEDDTFDDVDSFDDYDDYDDWEEEEDDWEEED